METMDIIKEAFLFPSQNLEKLAIYIVITFVVGILIGGGVILTAFGAYGGEFIYVILSLILIIIGIIVSFIISGYQLGILKSGIDQVPEAPSFDWKNDLINGIKMLIVSIVYFIIPMIITLIIALITNIPGQFIDLFEQAAVAPANVTAATNATAPVVSGVSDAAMAALGTSIAITAIIAAVLFIIFAFLHTMGESRLANTGSLGEALNIPEAFKDITRIGVGKVVAVIILMIVVVSVISGILGYIYGQVPQLSILSVIVTPYLTFFAQRATGLLYSDIA